MYCNMCGENKATVHFSQVINAKATELHLCEECARKQGFITGDEFTLSNMLAGISNNIFVKPKSEELKCSFCKLTYKQFRKVGRLGCAECYKAFHEPLSGLLKTIHGSQAHVGKLPSFVQKKSGDKADINQLKQELRKLVEREEYEKAAKIREVIRKMQENHDH